ncbi:MAG: hypothetical protein M0R77_00280 [Gammaproteobacteria bacterium]|nr:hypothetical protein [Acholeplasmataceae bacterium]MCK9528991.1 hypothetical protein [Gammaproteobacteria bacterium]
MRKYFKAETHEEHLERLRSQYPGRYIYWEKSREVPKGEVFKNWTKIFNEREAKRLSSQVDKDFKTYLEAAKLSEDGKALA